MGIVLFELKSQVCLVRELKINTARMNQTEIEHLQMLFVEAKWLRNALLNSGDINTFYVGKTLTTCGDNVRPASNSGPLLT